MEEIIEGEIARTSSGRIVIPGDMLAVIISKLSESCKTIEVSDGLDEDLKNTDIIIEPTNTLRLVETVPMY